MKLQSVKISSFRSIENMELPFSGNGHKVLVGKNESGKSNILNALKMLSGKVEFEKMDKKSTSSRIAHVIFSFRLEPHEIDICQKEFYGKFLVDKKVALTAQKTIEEFFNSHGTYIIYIARHQSKGDWAHWKLVDELKTKENWYTVKPEIDDTEYKMKLSVGKIINESFIKNEFNEDEQKEIKSYLTKISLIGIFNSLRADIRKTVAPSGFTYPTLYWSYNSKKHDLPSQVNIEEFLQDQNSCRPLKNMFLLAGVPNDQIEDQIKEGLDLGHNRLQTFLSNVNREVNKYIRRSWKEFQHVEIELRTNGEEDIAIGIKDSKSSYNFEQRSDGFRRFICFLLSMSARIEKERTHSMLILIDEPEVGLHPSSSKDLRDKLIELGKENVIVYATHSISMIDTENIENNLIVTRENEDTRIEVADEDGTSPAENVYQAIGYSIYEDLKKKNILLEGYTDKKLLKFFMTGKDWNPFGICFTDGVKDIKSAFLLLDLLGRKYFVLSDADKVATQKKNETINPEFWYTYEDLNCDAVTIEDFYEENFFYKVVKEVLQEYGIETPDHVENGRIDSIRSVLYQKKEIQGKSSNKDIQELVKIIMRDIKLQCSKKSKKQDIIKDKVESMLNTFMEELNKNK